MIELTVFITDSLRRLELWYVLFTIENTHLNLALATVNKMVVRFFQRWLVVWIESSVVVISDFVQFPCDIDVEGHKMFYKHIWSSWISFFFRVVDSFNYPCCYGKDE